MRNRRFVGERYKDIERGTGIIVSLKTVVTCLIIVLSVLLSVGLSWAVAVPSLTIQDQIPATAGSTVAVPVSFAAGGSSITALAFSIDFDQTLLSFDPTDTDEDGIPDAITFNVPPAFGLKIASYDAGDTDGELDFIISDISMPFSALTDGIVVTITFHTLNPQSASDASVNFSQNPVASFGNTSGQSVSGTTDDGSVLIQFANYYCDNDSDGYIDISPDGSCSGANCPPVGCSLTQGNDCNDGNAAIKPGATEVCDGVDNDCDGQIDEGVKNTYYRDVDADTYGDSGNTTQACTQPAGYVTNSTDCDDNDNKEHPNQTWYKDSDGDGYSDGTTNTVSCTRPAGYKVASELTSTSGDCNDSNAAIKPGATEVCDGVDNDCDGQIDEGVKNTYYRDADSDTYGNLNVTTQACTLPAGYVTNSTDCNDSDNKEHPGQTWYKDTDGDGYSDGTTNTASCTRPTGYKVASELTATSGDCNDGNAAIKPGATEVCDGVDNDCDGQIDEGVKNTYYRDADGDTYGNAGDTTQACTVPAGYVTNSTDCNDSNAAIKPGATEVCDGVDNDCDGQIDEGVKNTYYRDVDADTYGDSGNTTQACTQPAGYVTNSTDCDDNDNKEHPNQTWYKDSDGDGYSDGTTNTVSCTRPAGYKVASELTATSGDCNDGNAAIKPGATEVCDGVDNNCNGQTDEGVKNTYYRDADGDTYGNAGDTTQACTVPAGYVTNSTDCNDGNASIHPYAQEIVDGIDNDCDGQTDELNNTVTIPAATGQGDIILTTNSSGCGFYDVRAITEAQAADDPGFNYPCGLVEFSLNCATADVAITCTGISDLTGFTYRKYGPTTPGNPATTEWYTFGDVTVAGNSITLHLQDGVLGDDTGVDGIIVDQGGPAQHQDPVAIPTMTEWGMIIFMALAGLGAIYYLRKQRRAGK